MKHSNPQQLLALLASRACLLALHAMETEQSRPLVCNSPSTCNAGYSLLAPQLTPPSLQKAYMQWSNLTYTTLMSPGSNTPSSLLPLLPLLLLPLLPALLSTLPPLLLAPLLLPDCLARIACSAATACRHGT
jgi:hypothetical protein